MDLIKPLTIAKLSELIEKPILGNQEIIIRGFNEIHKVRDGDVTFVDHPKYYQKSLQSAASVIIIDKEVDIPEGKALVVVDAPFDIYDKLTRHFLPPYNLEVAIEENNNIGKDTVVEPRCVISPSATIGNNCYLEAGVYIGPHTQIGDHVHIGPGTVVGSDAFYYKKKGNAYQKWHTAGRVIVQNHVDIGANCTINRGVSGDTIIGEGSKLDCLIHIGHGAVLGKNCLLAAQVGVSGKTIIGDNCVIYGQVGIAQSLHIGNNTTILAQSGVSKDLAGDNVYFGTPAVPAKEKFREMAALRGLPDFLRKNKL